MQIIVQIANSTSGLSFARPPFSKEIMVTGNGVDTIRQIIKATMDYASPAIYTILRLNTNGCIISTLKNRNDPPNFSIHGQVATCERRTVKMSQMKQR